jgi:hypothetical protein
MLAFLSTSFESCKSSVTRGTYASTRPRFLGGTLHRFEIRRVSARGGQLMANHTLDGTSGKHQWLERREPHLKIESGEAVIQHQCVRCGRDIVTVLSSGSRHAVHVSMSCFYPLDDEVTERWLTEPCPGKRLPRDDDDRQRKVAKPSPLTLSPQPPKSRENRDRLTYLSNVGYRRLQPPKRQGADR